MLKLFGVEFFCYQWAWKGEKMKTNKFLSKLGKHRRGKVVRLIKSLPPVWLIKQVIQIQNIQSHNAPIPGQKEKREDDKIRLGEITEDQAHLDRFLRLKMILIAS